MTGKVNSRMEAIIRLTLRGPTGRSRRIRAVIDTGFDGSLSLPASLITELELPWHRRAIAELADGSETVFDVYRAVVVWNRRRIRIHVDEAETTPLVGMELLTGFKMMMEIIRGGKVTIEPLGRGRGN